MSPHFPMQGMGIWHPSPSIDGSRLARMSDASPVVPMVVVAYRFSTMMERCS